MRRAHGSTLDHGKGGESKQGAAKEGTGRGGNGLCALAHDDAGHGSGSRDFPSQRDRNAGKLQPLHLPFCTGEPRSGPGGDPLISVGNQLRLDPKGGRPTKSDQGRKGARGPGNLDRGRGLDGRTGNRGGGRGRERHSRTPGLLVDWFSRGTRETWTTREMRERRRDRVQSCTIPVFPFSAYPLPTLQTYPMDTRIPSGPRDPGAQCPRAHTRHTGARVRLEKRGPGWGFSGVPACMRGLSTPSATPPTASLQPWPRLPLAFLGFRGALVSLGDQGKGAPGDPRGVPFPPPGPLVLLPVGVSGRVEGS